MVALLDNTKLYDYFHANLERYVAEHPGQVVVLAYAPGRIREQFMTKSNYRELMKANKASAQAILANPHHGPIGGGFIGGVIYEEIPHKVPRSTVTIEGLEGLFAPVA